MSNKVAVVTGANSGIGRATAIHLATNGFVVYGTVRAVGKADKLKEMAEERGAEVRLIELDIASDDSVRDGFNEIIDRAGHIDVLVNNAGVGGNSVAEEAPPSLYLDVMNVNLCGAVRCVRAVLPQMRSKGEGTIVNISSIAGRIAALAQSPYSTSKWALEGFSEGLAQELAPFGIRVVVIEPGVTRSSIFAKNIDAPDQDGSYDAHYRRMFHFYAKGMANATDPFEVGALIHHTITTDAPKLRYACSWGGPEVVAGRSKMSDEEWVDLGRIATDGDYFTAFSQSFGLDIT